MNRFSRRTLLMAVSVLGVRPARPGSGARLVMSRWVRDQRAVPGALSDPISLELVFADGTSQLFLENAQLICHPTLIQREPLSNYVGSQAFPIRA